MNKTERQFKKSSKRLGITRYTPRMGKSTASRWKREGNSIVRDLTK